MSRQTEQRKNWFEVNGASLTYGTISHIHITRVRRNKEDKKRLEGMMAEISPDWIETINTQIQEA